MYLVYNKNNYIGEKTKDELRVEFIGSDERFDKYLEYEIAHKNLVKVITPKEFGQITGIKILSNNIKLAAFDRACDEDCLWNYPLDEMDEVRENCTDIVAINFSDAGYRICELTN